MSDRLPTTGSTTQPWQRKRSLAARGRALVAKRSRSITTPEEEDATSIAPVGRQEEATGQPEPASNATDAALTAPVSPTGEDEDDSYHSEDEDEEFTEEKAERILSDFLQTMPRDYRR